MDYDYTLLKDKIKKQCKTQAVFASNIELSERSTSLKLTGAREWKQSEIEKACIVLDINRSDITEYFFRPKVQN